MPDEPETDRNEPQSNQQPRIRRAQSKVGVATLDLDRAIETVRQFVDAQFFDVVPLDEAANRIAEEGPARSTFKNRLYSAARYGLVGIRFNRLTEQTEVWVLPLGRKILDQATEREAKVEAFLHVEMNRETYRHFLGRAIPPTDELDDYLRNVLGVSPGQVASGRQTFIRSARQAGLFEQRRDQLIIPPDVSLDSELLASAGEDEVAGADSSNGGTMSEPVAPSMPAEREAPTTPRAAASPVADQCLASAPVDITQLLQQVGFDPLIAAFIAKIPPGRTWPRRQRELWFNTFPNILALAFGDEDAAEDRDHTLPATAARP